MRTFLICLLLGASPHAATLNVGPSQTYSTLRAAASAAGPGDSIVVHAGTYAGNEWIDGLQGTARDWITVCAASGAAPVWDGGGTAWHLVDPTYLRISGLTAQGQTSNGVNVDDSGTYATPAHHVIFEGCTFRQMNATGNNDLLKLSGVDSFEVRGCVFGDGSADGSGVDMVGCHHGLFVGNRFERMGSNAIQAKGGSRHVTIERNFFEDCGQRTLNLGGSTGLQFFRPDTAHYEAADLHVYSNVIVGSEAAIAYVGCANVDVVNNTIFKPTRWVVRILQETVDTTRFVKCGNSVFRNNIVYRGTISTDCNVGDNTAPSTFTFSNNLWYNFANPGSSAPRDLPVADLNNVVGTNPLFADTAARDFTIPANSPAAQAGLTVAQPTVDFRGLGFAASRSIGAFEANPSAVRLLHGIRPQNGTWTRRTSWVFDLGGRVMRGDLRARATPAVSASGLSLSRE
jgi:hypothetical protein